MTTHLTPTWVLGSVDLTYFPFSVDRDNSVEIGEPEMIVESYPSMLADGDHERVVRHGNRVYKLDIYIEGSDLVDLAQSEAILRREVNRRGLELEHNPGDGFGLTSVYEVRTAVLTPQRIDSYESHMLRKFTLTLTCAPFARSLDAVTVDALPTGSSSPTLVDACDSTTGWTSSTDGAVVTTSGGAVISTRFAFAVDLIRTGSIDMSSTRYLLLESDSPQLTTWINGTIVLPSQNRLLASGNILSIYDTAGVTVTSLRVLTKWRNTLSIFDVSKSAAMPQVSPRQITRVVEVGGTERTPGSIHVQSEDGTDALGQVVVHTCPEDGSGYSPPLQRWRTVGQTRTADATAFSGNYELINVTSWAAEVPTSALPEGGYSLVARMRAQTAATVLISWSTSTIFPDATTQQGFTLGQKSHTFTADQEWDIVPLAVLSLPSVRTLAGKVQIALQVEAASPVVTLDEAWLFREDDDCALSIVKTERPHLWLDSADIASPVPLVWVGDGAATKVHPGAGLVAQGTHVLSPDGTAVFTAALTDNPATDATFHRRWHSNAAE